jgi:hypothetical protein
MKRPIILHGDTVELTIGGVNSPHPRVGVYVRSRGYKSRVKFDDGWSWVPTSQLIVVPNETEMELRKAEIRQAKGEWAEADLS